MWLDFRTTDENELQGTGRRIEDASESITLQIEKKKTESAGALNAYIYPIMDAQLNIQNGAYVSVVYNNKNRSHTQLDSRKQVIAFQDRVITINIKEAQHPLKREKQVIDKSSIMLKISTKSMHRVLV